MHFVPWNLRPNLRDTFSSHRGICCNCRILEKHCRERAHTAHGHWQRMPYLEMTPYRLCGTVSTRMYFALPTMLDSYVSRSYSRMGSRLFSLKHSPHKHFSLVSMVLLSSLRLWLQEICSLELRASMEWQKSARACQLTYPVYPISFRYPQYTIYDHWAVQLSIFH